jgi:hypothetical protein
MNTVNGVATLTDCGGFETTIIAPENGKRVVVTCSVHHREIIEVKIGFELYYLLEDYWIWQNENWISVKEIRGEIYSYYNKRLDYNVIRKYVGRICVPSCNNWFDRKILIGRK